MTARLAITESSPSDAPREETVEATRGRLDLIAPQDLPAELTLSPDGAARMRTILGAFLKALEDADPSRRAVRVAAVLVELGPGEPQIATVGYTGIPEDQEGVADFDDYFGVRRVVDADVAGALARSLLQGSAAVLALCARSPALPQSAVAMQIEGFRAQSMLLARILRLGDLR